MIIDFNRHYNNFNSFIQENGASCPICQKIFNTYPTEQYINCTTCQWSLIFMQDKYCCQQPRTLTFAGGISWCVGHNTPPIDPITKTNNNLYVSSTNSHWMMFKENTPSITIQDAKASTSAAYKFIEHTQKNRSMLAV